MSHFYKIPTYYANFDIYNIPKVASAPARLSHLGMNGMNTKSYEYRAELLRERYMLSVSSTPQDAIYGFIFILPTSPMHDISAPSPSPTHYALQANDFKNFKKASNPEDVIFICPDSPHSSYSYPRPDSPFPTKFNSPRSWNNNIHTIDEKDEDENAG